MLISYSRLLLLNNPRFVYSSFFSSHVKNIINSNYNNESLETRKARLVYQSRKRGMLENGLLLGSFASRYLGSMNERQVDLYDSLINTPSNDWDIYYWATGLRDTPTEFDNEVMDLFKRHTRNTDRECRFKLPDLK